MSVDPNQRFRSAAEMAAALAPSTDPDTTVANSIDGGAGIAAVAAEAPTVAISPTPRVGDVEPRDGRTQLLPAVSAAAAARPAAAPIAAVPAPFGGAARSRRVWNRVLAAGLVAGLTAAVIGVVASRDNPARPTVPATSISTTPPTTSLTRVTSTSPTTPTTPTTRPPVVTPAGRHGHVKDHQGKGNGDNGD
jgi:hypothetical protein